MGHTNHPEISRAIRSLLGKIDKLDTPTCFRENDKNAEIFVGLTNAFFAAQHICDREDFLKELGNPERKIGWGKQDIFTGDDVVGFAMRQLNRDRIQSARIVGERLGIKPENCFDAFPPSANDEVETGAEPGSYYLLPKEVHVGDSIFYLSHVDEQYNFRGKVCQAICRYSNKNDSFFIVASVVLVRNSSGSLSIGHAPASAWAFSRAAIDTFPNSAIIFPMSLHVAFHLRKLHREAKLNEQDGIISGHFGNIESLDLHCFCSRKVILLPEFSRDGYLKAKAFASKIQSSVKEVKIYPWPIVAAGMPADAMVAGSGSPWKESLLEQMVDLKEELAPSSLRNRIIAKALSIPDFEKLLVEVGLVASKEGSQLESCDALQVTTLEASQNSDEIDVSAELSLDLLIQPNFILFMWGGGHSGKSFILMTLILGVATGTRAFCLSGSKQRRKVLLLDGELTKDQFRQRLSQLTQNNKALFDSASKNICCYFAREAGSLDLLNPEHQKSILARIKMDEIKVLAIDNLISLADKALKGASVRLFDFLYAVEREGVAVIFVNHATKGNAESKGSVDIENKSQTIIHIEGRKILSEDKDLSTAVKSALEKDEGIVVRLTFDKCKLPPTLNEKYEIYHLPVHGSWNYIEGNLPVDKPLDVVTFDGETSATSISSAEDLNSIDAVISKLSEDQQTLYNLFRPGNKLTRRDVQEHFNWGEDKAGKELKALKENELITAVGSGPAIAYKKSDHYLS